MLEQLRATYDNDVWRAEQAAKSNRHISCITFLWACPREITRPKLPEHFEVQKGIRTTYEWLVLGLGCYASRRLACNCSSCLDTKCRGAIEPSAMGQVPSSTPRCAYISIPTLFGWNRRSCKAVKKSVVAATLSDSQDRARTDVPKLESGMWVFFQARECPDDD